MEDEWLPRPRYVRVWVVPALLGCLHLLLAVAYLGFLHGWVRALAVLSCLTWVAFAVKWHRAEARRE